MTEQDKEPTQAPRVLHEQTQGHIQLTAFEEIAAWLSNMRNPGAFDTRVPFTIIPKSLEVKDLENLMPQPSRVRKNLLFVETASFLEYFKTFKNGYKPMLSVAKMETGLRALCVFDYDLPAETVADDGAGNVKATQPVPRWGNHRARLELQYSDDYKLLREHDGEWFSQRDFALFVEANLHLFVNPEAAAMLEMAQHLKGARSVQWQTGKRLANGETKMEYTEAVEARGARGDLIVPDHLILSCSIFEGYPPQPIKLAFSWDIDGNKATFSYRMLTKIAEREAVDNVKKALSEGTGLHLHVVADISDTARGL